MEELKNNQNQLMEKERLATLGQMIGGVAHNLKTPIMSVAGADEGLSQLSLLKILASCLRICYTIDKSEAGLFLME